MDSKENSYSYIKNTENDILGVDDITVHFDNLNIPESAIIEKMYLKSIIEPNTLKEIHCSYGVQNNYVVNEAQKI